MSEMLPSRATSLRCQNRRGGPRAPFGTPVLVAELADPNADDEDPTFTEDLLELYFMSDRGGNADIWRSLRAATDDRWGTPTRIVELSSTEIDQTPSVSLDGLTLWFTSEGQEARRATTSGSRRDRIA